MQVKIFLHAGHGGTDPGAVGPTGLKEKDVTLKVCKKLKKVFEECGFNIILSRESDITQPSWQSVQIANKEKADYLISIHCNSATNPSATGTETFAWKKNTKSDKFAHAVQKELVSHIKLPNRGVKYGNFSIISQAKMPAILVELAFINNPKEEALLKDDSFLAKAVDGIVQGFLNYLEGVLMGKVKMKIKGKKVDIRGFMMNNTNYATVRDIAEALGYKVSWDNKEQMIIIE